MRSLLLQPIGEQPENQPIGEGLEPERLQKEPEKKDPKIEETRVRLGKMLFIMAVKYELSLTTNSYHNIVKT